MSNKKVLVGVYRLPHEGGDNMGDKKEYTVTVQRKGWFTVMASDFSEAKDIAYEMSDKELEQAARWEETEVYDVD